MTAPVLRPSATPPRLESRVDVETPEQVVLSYTVAGVGSRAAAAIVDALICVGAFVVVGIVWNALGAPGHGRLGAAERWLFAIVVFAQFALLWGYYVLFEVLHDGQTPGKRLLGLRVVQDGGQALSLGGAAARNLVRIVDMQPAFTYLVGIVSAAMSPRGRRLGDVVAGTIVVREQAVSAPFAADVVPGAPNDAERALPPAALLSDEEFALLERYMARRQAIDPARRQAIALQLARRLKPRVPTEVDAGLGATDYAWLAALHDRERRARAGVAVLRAAGTARGSSPTALPHALVARGAGRWREFAALFAAVQRRRGGLRALGEDEVSDFVARYREVATDLARLQTAARGRDHDAVFYLARLVAAGHNLVYRREESTARTAIDFVLRQVPAEVRRSWRPIAIAALLLFAPAVASFTAVVRDPTLVTELVPPSLLERAESGQRRGPRGGYLPEDEAGARGPVLASVIMSNNVQITFGAFALGITAGIGTCFLLVMNGVAALGAPLGLYASKGILGQILGFVLPHGVLELSAICIAGGAGLLLASAILLPGARTRRDALVDESARAVRLICASTLMLVVAGLLEGNVSPLVWPLAAKGAVSAATAVMLAGWLWPRRAA
ncbi:protein of unknown function DUF95 transmembrane [Gemmatirosa kalamazoonensis]|uniref:RDD domain-containing protein n=1 Tax=Gemmatirosa kalamazoonensis TaxID=861299 RepID=W0RKN1_9BACT|nr:stage II sporulation protein M [Gemmatirosa kalamazoonensis]AHG89993.1 protein of unknown function DUF95 transmembrane [Gemmatirosa kalamazoonensis]